MSFFPCLLAHRRVRETAASLTHLEQKALTTNSLALGLEAKKKRRLLKNTVFKSMAAHESSQYNTHTHTYVHTYFIESGKYTTVCAIKKKKSYTFLKSG